MELREYFWMYQGAAVFEQCAEVRKRETDKSPRTKDSKTSCIYKRKNGLKVVIKKKFQYVLAWLSVSSPAVYGCTWMLSCFPPYHLCNALPLWLRPHCLLIDGLTTHALTHVYPHI